jgi:SAM-dependent methyltransferase
VGRRQGLNAITDGADHHWFEAMADHLGPAYLRYSFTTGTEQEVDFLVEALGLVAGERVLDVGCGPGRHLAALHAAGKPGLGVDLSPVAVRLARGRGVVALPGNVFAAVPWAGRWRTVLLLDGNIGIGGAPALLLRRTRELLAPAGSALVELDPPGAPTYRTRVRLEAWGTVSEWFRWARVGVDGIESLCGSAGLRAAGAVRVGGRWFARLQRP